MSADPMPAPRAGAGEREQQPNGAVSFVEVVRDAVEYMRELAAWEQRAWEGYRPERYERPLACAAALTALAELLERLKAARRLPDNDAAADLVLALLDALCAGYHPTPEPEPQG